MPDDAFSQERSPNCWEFPTLWVVEVRKTHEIIDRVNAAQDRRIAAKLQRNPAVLRLARANLRRWAASDGPHMRPVFREWHAILYRLNAREIADFLRSDTLMARRLRQSSPFAGALARSERELIRRQYEEA